MITSRHSGAPDDYPHTSGMLRLSLASLWHRRNLWQDWNRDERCLGSGMKSTNLILATLAVLICGALPVASAESHFVPASTVPETALDRILHLADSDGEQLANLLHRPGADGRVDYAQILTPALIAAMRNTEKQLVQEDCGGKYLQGEICGLDYSPITCAQDTAPSYIYHTVLELGDRAVIEYAWPSGKVPVATYMIVKVRNGWKIDGVTCAHGGKFN